MSGRRSDGTSERSKDGGQTRLLGDSLSSPSSGSVAHVHLDASGRVSSWNQVAANLLGYETESVVGTPLAELLGEDRGGPWVEDALYRAAHQGQIVEVVRHVRQDGSEVEAKITLSVARGSDGEQTGYICGIGPLDGDEKTSDRRLRSLWALFEKSPDSIVVHDLDGEVLQVNKQNIEDLGYTREELLSMNVADYEAGHDVEELQEIWADMKTGSREKFETRLRQKDGKTYPAEVTLTKIRVDGEPLFLAHGRDMTERKRRERNLQRRRAFLENTSDVVILLDENGAVQYQNHSMEHLRYPTLHETVDEDPMKYVHPEDRGIMKETLDAVLEEPGTPERMELRVRARNGEWRWLENQAINLLDDPDVGGILVSSRDVTDRIQYERELKEERDSLQSIIESLPYPFYVVDVTDHSVEYMNSLAAVNGGEFCYEITHRRDRPCDEGEDAVACPIREIKETGEPTTVEHVHTDESGDEQIYEVFASPIYDDEGAVKRVAVSAIDVTERNEYAQQLENQRDRLRRIRKVTEGIRPLNRALARASTREEVVSLVCEKLTQASIYRFAWFGDYDPLHDSVTPEDWAGVEDGYLDDFLIDLDDEEAAKGQVGRSIRNREVHATRNIATDPAFEPWREAALERGYRSVASIPVVIEGNVHGVINVYSERPNAFETYEQELLGELGERVGHAIQAAGRHQLLHAEATQQLVFRTDDERSPFVDVSKRLGCRFELQTVVPTAESSYIGYMTVEGAPPEEVVDHFERDDAIENARVIFSNGTAGRIEYTVSTSPVTTLLEYDVSVSSAVIDEGEEVVRAEVAPETSTKPIVAGLQSAFGDVELVAKRSVDRSVRTPQSVRESIGDAVTDRQREILSLAFQAGYFESPRRSTGEELAETIGIAAPTFYVHVRRGTRNVLEQLDEFEILE